jgi:1-pyrroline-5-carboxylate dehydrogenase
MSAPVANPPRTSPHGSGADATTHGGAATSQPQPVPSMGGVSGFSGNRRVPTPLNEPVRSYAPGSPEKKALKARLKAMAGERADIPVIIGGEEIRTGETMKAVMPHDHSHVLAEWHKATPEHVERAIAAANAAHHEWANWSWEDRAAVFLKAAELLATTWRDTVNAATMLGQSKTVHQAEIDAACELIDFWRFNPAYAQELYDEQPLSDRTMWNQLDYRALEGFVYAVTPFNFTSIAGNLPTAPALMGNTVIWKPASTSMLSSYYLMKLLEEAGLPPGVINFVPGDPAAISERLLGHRDLAGVHFTGSTGVFNAMWETIGRSMKSYHSYPRIVGETGGKDFVVAHASADVQALAVGLVRGAFEFQGQKCSAASRAYVPKSLWPQVKDAMVAMLETVKQGDPRDFRNFMAAVIDEKAFRKISEYIEHAKSKGDEIVFGGKPEGKKGWFIPPTVVRTEDAGSRLLCEEIFGPVLTVYVYDDARWEETLRTIDTTSPYALTGAVFARDRKAVKQAMVALRNAAGNFYVNDKPTGAVVGQQPFGGARGSGTNDKAGSKLNLVRWVSARNVKETFSPPRSYEYPFMGEE